MKDIISTTAITSAMILTAISPIGASAKEMITTPITSTVATTTSVVSNLWDTNDGSVGRLSISGYSAELYASSSQSVVDAEDSAAYMDWGSVIAIADHAYQGFRIIRSLGAGATGTITDNSTVTYITMASSYQGKNTGAGINLNDGRYAEQVTDGKYMLYTCNDSTGVDVTVTYWNVSGSEAVAAPVAAPVQEVAAAEPVAEPAAQTVTETAPAEQPVVDTTVTEQTQQSQVETTVTEQTSSTAPVVGNVVDTNTAIPEFATTSTTNNSSSTAQEANFSDLLTANKQAASDKLYAEFDNTAYYADNRRWLALASADQSESNIVA